jgi:hypothetical protein
MKKHKMNHKERIQQVKAGNLEPKTAQECAIFWKAQRKRNEGRMQNLHKTAAINKPSTMTGKIVVVPPQHAR